MIRFIHHDIFTGSIIQIGKACRVPQTTDFERRISIIICGSDYPDGVRYIIGFVFLQSAAVQRDSCRIDRYGVVKISRLGAYQYCFGRTLSVSGGCRPFVYVGVHKIGWLIEVTAHSAGSKIDYATGCRTDIVIEIDRILCETVAELFEIICAGGGSRFAPCRVQHRQ